MDEVDGRPGPVALQLGHLDASPDVPMNSLSLPLFRTRSATLFHQAPAAIISATDPFFDLCNPKEKQYENVSGK